MKPIYCILITISILLFSSCSSEDIVHDDSSTDSNEQIVYFKVALAGLEQTTKGKDEITGLDTQNFYLLVFNEQGLFLERRKALFNGNSFQVRLTPSSKKRIIHFIGNYSFSGLSDAAVYFKSEKEIIASMQIKNEVAYWKRLEFPTGISKNAFPAAIELIRNIAKVSVNNNSSGYPRIENVEFTLINQSDQGTVAPFRKSDGTFPEGWVTESNQGSILGPGTFTSQAQYLYEKVNKSSQIPLSVIIRGNFKASATSSNVLTYYKIDFVDNTSLCNVVPIDIIRNMHYIVTLKSVSKLGYPDLQQAISSPASNNIINSIELQDLKTISDGTSVLSVDKTSFILVKANGAYEINYNYYPNGLSQPADNSNMSIQLVNDDPERPVLNAINTSVSGKISFVTDQFPKQGNRTGYIRICKNGLARIVRLTFKYPYVFEMPYLTPNPIALGQNKIVDLKFTIPNTIPASEFPLNIYILTTKLSPDASSGLQVDVSGSNYKFIYKAANSGEKSIRFRTVYDNSSHECLIESPLFSDAAIRFEVGTSNSKYISAWFSVKPRYVLSGQPIAINLYIPSTDQNPVSLDINNTSYLEADSNYNGTGYQSNIIVSNNKMVLQAIPVNKLVTIYLRTKGIDYPTGTINLSGAGFVSTSDINKTDI